MMKSLYCSSITSYQRLNMKKLFFIIFICSACCFQYCASSKKNVKPAEINYTYVGHIQPTIMANCSPCHIPPKGFKKALDNYLAVKENIGDIIMRIKLKPGEKGFMPFKHERLSDSVINIFVKWNEKGLAEK